MRFVTGFVFQVRRDYSKSLEDEESINVGGKYVAHIRYADTTVFVI